MSSKEFFLRKDYLETKPDGTEKAVNVRVDGSGYQKFDKDPRDTKGQWFRRALDDINSEAQIGTIDSPPSFLYSLGEGIVQKGAKMFVPVPWTSVLYGKEAEEGKTAFKVYNVLTPSEADYTLAELNAPLKTKWFWNGFVCDVVFVYTERVEVLSNPSPVQTTDMTLLSWRGIYHKGLEVCPDEGYGIKYSFEINDLTAFLETLNEKRIPPTSDDVISYLGEHIDNAFRDAFGSVGFLDAIKNELKFREEVRTNVSKAFSNLSIDLIGLKIGQMHVPHVVRNRFFWLNAAKVDPRQVLWAETAHLVSQADRAMGQDLVLHLGDEKKSLTRSRPKKE